MFKYFKKIKIGCPKMYAIYDTYIQKDILINQKERLEDMENINNNNNEKKNYKKNKNLLYS